MKTLFKYKTEFDVTFTSEIFADLVFNYISNVFEYHSFVNDLEEMLSEDLAFIYLLSSAGMELRDVLEFFVERYNAIEDVDKIKL